jgi:hypothetical protein
MIKNDQELQAMLERTRQFQLQVAKLRRMEPNPQNYRLSSSGYLAELDRMTLEVREYIGSHPAENQSEAAATGRFWRAYSPA